MAWWLKMPMMNFGQNWSIGPMAQEGKELDGPDGRLKVPVKNLGQIQVLGPMMPELELCCSLCARCSAKKMMGLMTLRMSMVNLGQH